jgi:predicted enzyme related to lactoylglutathione lyase
MINGINTITILVKDQDEALAFYTEKMGLEKRTDQIFGEGTRWLTVAPSGMASPEIYLALPFSEDQSPCIGKNATWSFSTSECHTAYTQMKSQGVEFVQPPTPMPWGLEAVFLDLYGNSFSLLQPEG